MGEDKSSLPNDPFAWIFRASLLLLGTAIVLNLAVAWLRPITHWLAGAAVLIAGTWVTAAIIRWQRSKY
ncbi:hypothetical protein ACFQHV_15730 [Promicromonospora thailandica]|uniref:Uncharacterized protein n=1 Tax=Promicromonospora thailandica TaxID=765201 RepID=A0A9X2G2R5_9MICO|nr:hypothetical protein [Promicromonospora thailandica]MCP2264623.1 hypothetical protein [Promicromonospora thailandica]BFF20307.1 hypothetical protein GCM10025730_38280 [Promicromonospora thailandica]